MEKIKKMAAYVSIVILRPHMSLSFDATNRDATQLSVWARLEYARQN